MECCVHSPCGRYLVRYRSDSQSIALDVRPKPAASDPSPTVRYVAVLHESHIGDITEAAGVRKDFAAFADMTYNAMIGRSPCVKFFIETCGEMRRRVASEVTQCQQGVPSTFLTIANSSQSSQNSQGNSSLPESTGKQRFFTLDYDVDFTRAMFPVPLTEETFLTRDLPGSVVPQERTVMPSCIPAGAAGSPCAKLSCSGNVNEEQFDRAIAVLQAENEKLKRENVALKLLCRDKMLEMQKLCDDFQKHVEKAHEVERLQKKLTLLRTQLVHVEEERDEALVRLKIEKQRSERSASSLNGSRSNRSTRHRSRFDTPPTSCIHASPQAALYDSPRARHVKINRESRSTTRNRSGSSEGLSPSLLRPWGKKRGSGAGSRSSSCSSCERLYRSPTANSLQRERRSPNCEARRAVFR
ncbi:hypothetical protein TRVL_02278 [Trypanosoma vivax]|nr:hypothetical protein TRVL_02278 [Trypanosoma vivax]